MTKTVLLIHSKYPLGTNAGDKIRTLNMAVSLKRLGYNVIFLGFYTRRIGNRRNRTSSIRCRTGSTSIALRHGTGQP